MKHSPLRLRNMENIFTGVSSSQHLTGNPYQCEARKKKQKN